MCTWRTWWIYAARENTRRPYARGGCGQALKAKKQLPCDVPVFLESSAIREEAARAVVLGKGMHLCQHATNAVIFVVKSLGQASVKTQWAATLSGGIMCDEMYFLSDGSCGSSILYRRQISAGGTRMQPRRFWPSKCFQQHHAELLAVLRMASTASDSVWQEIDREGFAAMTQRDQGRPHRQRRPLQAIALVGQKERESASFLQQMPNVFDADAFISKFKRVNLEESVSGITGL